MKPEGAVVVAERSFLSQTTGFSPTTIFTPTEDGEFIIGIFLEGDATNGGPLQASYSYTNDNGSAGDNTETINGGPGYKSLFQFFHAVSGQPIQVHVSSFSGTASYNLFVSLISL